jgi:hypothetical protein
MLSDAQHFSALVNAAHKQDLGSENYIRRAIAMCKEYGFDAIFGPKKCYAAGIGDILYVIVGIKNGIIKAPAQIATTLFVSVNQFYANPLNFLEFRLKMLCDVLAANELPKSSIQFLFGHDLVIREPKIYAALTTLHLKQPVAAPAAASLPPNYIIIHTKIRHDRLTHNRAYPYDALKPAIAEFAKRFRSAYPIVLMGEKEMLQSFETTVHKMQSCYQELLPLADNNTLIDLTSPCFDTLNYEQYAGDVAIVANTVANISFGSGGSFCTAMIFGKCTYAHTFVSYNPIVLAEHDAHIYIDYTKMIADIEERFGTMPQLDAPSSSPE